jgi:RNase adaptor protein for sRNA GlmZ degradation
MSKIYFITGVNGVGKSTLIPILEDRLDPAAFAIHDFDERGVPDSADSVWRLSETIHWVQAGEDNAKKGVSTVICGFVKAKEISQAAEESGAEIEVCLLEANDEAIEARIMSRYATPESLQELERTTGKTLEKFVQDNIWVAGKFREEAIQAGWLILNTSDLRPEQIADSLEDWF